METSGDALWAEMKRFIELQLGRIAINLARVEALILASEHYFLKGPEAIFELHRQDILRGAVILLHATLENFLRHIGLLYLPKSGEEALNRIPLVGSERPDKFLLGRLVEHRGKTIEQVIASSVAAHLDRSTFNNPSDIAALLTTADIESASATSQYPLLAALIARRHQIVHRADVVENPDGGRQVSPIDADLVRTWQRAVVVFISAVVSSCIGRDFGAALAERALLQLQRTTEPTATDMVTEAIVAGDDRSLAPEQDAD